MSSANMAAILSRGRWVNRYSDVHVLYMYPYESSTLPAPNSLAVGDWNEMLGK